MPGRPGGPLTLRVFPATLPSSVRSFRSGPTGRGRSPLTSELADPVKQARPRFGRARSEGAGARRGRPRRAGGRSGRPPPPGCRTAAAPPARVDRPDCRHRTGVRRCVHRVVWATSSAVSSPYSLWNRGSRPMAVARARASPGGLGSCFRSGARVTSRAPTRPLWTRSDTAAAPGAGRRTPARRCRSRSEVSSAGPTWSSSVAGLAEVPCYTRGFTRRQGRVGRRTA